MKVTASTMPLKAVHNHSDPGPSSASPSVLMSFTLALLQSSPEVRSWRPRCPQASLQIGEPSLALTTRGSAAAEPALETLPAALRAGRRRAFWRLDAHGLVLD